MFYRSPTHQSQIRAWWRAVKWICPSVLRTKWICLPWGIHFATERVRISHMIPCRAEWILGCYSWIGGFGGKGIWILCRCSCSIIGLGCKQVWFWHVGGSGTKRVLWGKGGAGGLCEERVCSKGVCPFEWISSERVCLSKTRNRSSMLTCYCKTNVR